MTKRIKISSHSQPGPTLFDMIVRATESGSAMPPIGSLDIRTQLKAALAQDIRHACDEHGREISRAVVAALMSDLTGERITEDTIDNWTAPSHTHRMPLDYLPAWVRATGGQKNAVDALARHCGLFMLPGPEALRADTQAKKEQRRKLDKEIRAQESWIEQFQSQEKRS